MAYRENLDMKSRRADADLPSETACRPTLWNYSGYARWTITHPDHQKPVVRSVIYLTSLAVGGFFPFLR
jgi:hypothetical protein